MAQIFVAFSEYLNFDKQLQQDSWKNPSLDDVFLLAKLDKAVLMLTKFEIKFYRKKMWKGFGPFVKDIGSK